jgi:lysophospholipase L1-like esterase
MSDLAIDLYLPGETASASPVTTHNGAQQTSYVSAAGNHAGAADLPVMTMTQAWFFLARVEVLAPASVGAVAVLGDSISDGTASTPDTNNRWPDHLARRLAAANRRMGVLNLGIAGNRVLSDGAGVNALARFDRDVLAQSGVTHVVVMEGINDFGIGGATGPSAADVIAGHQQLIARAHAAGLRIYAGTLTPFEGTAFPGYYSPENDAKRRALSDWIRTSGAYDGVIDFDAAVRDPMQPSRLLPQYAAGDNLHLSDAGYEAMARAVDLNLFGR